MVRTFPPFHSERKKRTISGGSLQFPIGSSAKLLFHLTFNRNFRIFFAKWQAPQVLTEKQNARYKGGGVAEWFRALDLKSGGPCFNFTTLTPSGFVLGSPELNSSTALCK